VRNYPAPLAPPKRGQLRAGAHCDYGSLTIFMNTRRIIFYILLALSIAAATPLAATPPSHPFTQRGYYITLMRMPVMGLPEWKRAIDCFAEDDINTLILWTAGGFRSKEFPITWAYNADHYHAGCP